jgi:hypothetical protein
VENDLDVFCFLFSVDPQSCGSLLQLIASSLLKMAGRTGNANLGCWCL